MLTVGLTGGFASGKTTVAKMFALKGAQVASADEIVHALLNSRRDCARKITRVFGKEILTAGRIDRRKLAAVVFKDNLARKTLERIIHPEVIREIKARVKSAQRLRRHSIFIVEVPLLFETGLEKNFDLTVTVIATRKEQIERALQTRALTRQEIIPRIQAQLPLAVKRRLADILIDNRGSFQYTRRQVDRIWQKLNKMKSV